MTTGVGSMSCYRCGRGERVVLRGYRNGSDGTSTVYEYVCTADGATYDAAGCRRRRGI